MLAKSYPAESSGVRLSLEHRLTKLLSRPRLARKKNWENYSSLASGDSKPSNDIRSTSLLMLILNFALRISEDIWSQSNSIVNLSSRSKNLKKDKLFSAQRQLMLIYFVPTFVLSLSKFSSYTPQSAPQSLPQIKYRIRLLRSVLTTHLAKLTGRGSWHRVSNSRRAFSLKDENRLAI